MSLLTVTAVNIDRPLALLFGLRYRQVVTMKLTCAQTQTRTQIQDPEADQKTSESTDSTNIVAVNIARWKRVISCTLWLQLTLVACYLPHAHGIVELHVAYFNLYKN